MANVFEPIDIHKVNSMRTMLTAVIALGAATIAMAAPVQAQVSIRTPGVTIDAGPQPYWRQQRADEWRRHEEFREAQYRRRDWQREHCVRDWDGRAYCR